MFDVRLLIDRKTNIEHRTPNTEREEPSPRPLSPAYRREWTGGRCRLPQRALHRGRLDAHPRLDKASSWHFSRPPPRVDRRVAANFEWRCSLGRLLRAGGEADDRHGRRFIASGTLERGGRSATACQAG